MTIQGTVFTARVYMVGFKRIEQEGRRSGVHGKWQMANGDGDGNGKGQASAFTIYPLPFAIYHQ
jgi:hypothetical protein